MDLVQPDNIQAKQLMVLIFHHPNNVLADEFQAVILRVTVSTHTTV
jgi:hypothetical protein